MLFIIIHHCVVNDFGMQNLVRYGEQSIVVSDALNFILILINAFVVTGVNLFFLVSGYCKIHFRLKKIVRFVVKVYVVFWIIEIIGLFTGQVELTMGTFRNIIDPLDYYWFIMTYVILYLTSPLLNMILERINLQQFKLFIIGFLLLGCVYAFFQDAQLYFNSGYSYIMAACLYLVGGGIKKFKHEISLLRQRPLRHLITYIGLGFINGFAVIILFKAGYGSGAWKLYSYNNILVAVESMALLLVFINMTAVIKPTFFIKELPKATIMTYLCHSTCWLTIFRKWPIVFVGEHISYICALVMLPVYAFLIYLICTVINIAFEKSIGRVIDSIISNVDGKNKNSYMQHNKSAGG